jgi:hypothetical protein
MSSEACHLIVKSENIVFSPMGPPYPTLPVYAQSLLDSRNGVNLDDLIDSMNLTPEWGEENLNVNGTVDADWIWWKSNLARGSNPDSRREIWTTQTSQEAKRARQTWKYEPDRATRFRKAGRKDPRLPSGD